MKRSNETDNAILEFIKLTLDNPNVLNDSEKAQKVAYEVLKNNINNKKHTNDDKKERA